MTVLLVGEAPSRLGDGYAPGKAPVGRSARRVLRLAGVERMEEIGTWVNLLARWPGRGGAKGYRFPLDRARATASQLWRTAPPDARVVFVGRRVASAFGSVEDEYLRWWRLRRDGIERRVAILPHPSGVNRWWNEPENEARAARFLRALARGERDG